MSKQKSFHPCTLRAVLRYLPGYKNNPDAVYDGGTYHTIERRDQAVRFFLEDPENVHTFGWARIESIDITEVFNLCGPLLVRRGLSRHYVEPTPHAALSFELRVRLSSCAKPGLWVHIKCESHKQRVLLAEHIARSGRLYSHIEADFKSVDDAVQIRPGVWKVKGLDYVDRTLVFDNEYSIRRSRIGSQARLDKDVTVQLRPLMKSLTAPASAAA